MEDSIEENENILQNEDNLSSEEADSDEDNEEKEWDLNYEEECNFWMNLKNRGYIYMPSNCQKSNSGKLEIKKLEKKNIINPYYVRCNTVFYIVLDFTLSWILAKIQDNVMDKIKYFFSL